MRCNQGGAGPFPAIAPRDGPASVYGRHSTITASSPRLVSPTVPTTADKPASVTARTCTPATPVTPDSCSLPTSVVTA